MHDEIYVYLVPLPGKVTEMVSPCQDGYNIVIDPRQSQDGIRRSFEHALKHIMGNDFEKECVQEIESDAHGAA